MLKKILGCITKYIIGIAVLVYLEVGKLGSFTTRKYTEEVRIGGVLESMSWGTGEETRNVNPGGKV